MRGTLCWPVAVQTGVPPPGKFGSRLPFGSTREVKRSLDDPQIARAPPSPSPHTSAPFAPLITIRPVVGHPGAAVPLAVILAARTWPDWTVIPAMTPPEPSRSTMPLALVPTPPPCRTIGALHPGG